MAEPARSSIPWRGWMAHGLGTLRLSPQSFWSLSLSEWAAILEAGREGGVFQHPLSSEELSRLMKAHPDGPAPPQGNHHG